MLNEIETCGVERASGLASLYPPSILDSPDQILDSLSPARPFPRLGCLLKRHFRADQRLNLHLSFPDQLQREFEIARSVSEATLHRELFLGHPHHGKLEQTLPQARLHERPAHLQQMHAHLNARLCAGSLEHHIAAVTEFVLFY